MNLHIKKPAAMALLGVLVILSVTSITGLGQSSRRPALIFSGIANPDNLDNYGMGYRAVIFVFNRGAWRLINLPEPYENAGWEYAGRSKSNPKVWAIAQFGRGDIGEDLEIAHSLNDGRTWRHLHSLKKVSRFARFESFSMARNGRGVLTIRLQDSPDREHRDGYYTYTTTNEGRTWSRVPRYSATAPPPASDNSLEQISIGTQLSGIPCSDPSSQTPPPN